MSSPERIILHLDLDYFYAQCEEREDPELKGLPLAVCIFSGRTSDSGVVSTCNYVARALGVRSGMPIVAAKKLLKERADSKFLPAKFELYEHVSERVFGIARSYADRLEQVSIDEAYLDVTKRTGGSYEEAVELATKLRQEIREKEGLTCSVGIGMNRLISKIAANAKKPDGLTVVRPEQVQEFLDPLPADRLEGVGTKTSKTLAEMGVNTIKNLRETPLERLTRVFGSSTGRYLYGSSRGIDPTQVEEKYERKQVSSIATLKEDSKDLEFIGTELKRLCERVVSEARAQGLAFRTIGIMAILDDLQMHSRSRTVPLPTTNLDQVEEVTISLLEDLLKEMPQASIRRAGIKLSGLVSDKGQVSIEGFF